MALAGRQQTFSTVPDAGTRQALLSLQRDINDVRNAVAGGGGGPVTSFNTRVGAVSLLASDIKAALGYTPRPIINAKDWATGNGVTDDTAALNNALASATRPFLYFPKGTYLVSSDLIAP